jgi:malate dehydrogenase
MRRRVAIIGAAGTVGSCTAFALLNRDLAEEVILMDGNASLLVAHKMDLESAFAALCDTRVTIAQPAEGLIRAEIVIVCASAPWKRVGSRMDLLTVNLPIMEKIAEDLKAYCPSAIVINVTNPVDPLNWVVKRQTGFSRQRCLGYSLNDSLRFRQVLAKELGIPASSVGGFVAGEHGEHCVPLFSSVRVGGETVAISEESQRHVRADLVGALQDFEKLGTGRTSGWTSAVGISGIVQAICDDTGEVFPCSVCLDGELGRTDIGATVPIRVGAEGFRETSVNQVSVDEREELNACFDHLEKVTQPLSRSMSKRTTVA